MAIQGINGQGIESGTVVSGTKQRSQTLEQSGAIKEQTPVTLSMKQVRERMELDPSYIPTLQEKTVINAIEQANKKLEGSAREFEFSIHEKTKQIMVKVLNRDTKEIVREIPSEKILDMVAAMCEQAGLFVDEKR